METPPTPSSLFQAMPGVLFSPRGRIDRRTFGLAILAVYVLWYLVPAVLATIGAFSGDIGTSLLLNSLHTPTLLVLTYVSLCLHLKRLADAGRRGVSFAVMCAATIALPILATVAALSMAGDALQGQSSMNNLNYPLVGGMMLFLWLGPTLLLIAVGWPIYSLWTGLAPSRPAPRETAPAASAEAA
ncbi:MAG: DUF805 domain-containing protein [Caulobacter sp.]